MKFPKIVQYDGAAHDTDGDAWNLPRDTYRVLEQTGPSILVQASDGVHFWIARDELELALQEAKECAMKWYEFTIGLYIEAESVQDAMDKLNDSGIFRIARELDAEGDEATEMVGEWPVGGRPR